MAKKKDISVKETLRQKKIACRKKVLLENISSNLTRLIADRKIKKTEIAKETGLQASAVTEFCKGDRLPSLTQLTLLTDYLLVSLDRIVSSSDAVSDIQNLDITYTQLFRIIKKVSVLGVLDLAKLEGIRDPFVRYMLDFDASIQQSPKILAEYLTRAQAQLASDFDMPVLDIEIAAKAPDYRSHYQSLDEYQYMVAILNMMEQYVTDTQREFSFDLYMDPVLLSQVNDFRDYAPNVSDETYREWIIELMDSYKHSKATDIPFKDWLDMGVRDIYEKEGRIHHYIEPPEDDEIPLID